MPSVVAIFFFFFGFRTQRETARGQISERDHVRLRLRLRRSEGRGGLRAGAGVCSPRLPAEWASRRCAEPCNSAAKPQTSPPGKGRKTPAFFSKKGARRPAGAREAAPHRPPPGKGANGTLRGRSPRTPEGVAHGHPDKRRRLGSRRRRRPPVHRGRGSRRLRPTEGSVEAPQARKRGPAHGPGAPLLGARPREETSLSGGETPLLFPAGGPHTHGCRGRRGARGRAGGGPRHWQGRDDPGGCDGERSPAQSSADTARHRTRRVRRTVGREGGEQQSARPGLGPARSGSRTLNTTRSPL